MSHEGIWSQLLVTLVAHNLIWALIGYAFGAWKGQPTWGFWLCLLLGPIGMLITALLPHSETSRWRISRDQRAKRVAAATEVDQFEAER